MNLAAESSPAPSSIKLPQTKELFTSVKQELHTEKGGGLIWALPRNKVSPPAGIKKKDEGIGAGESERSVPGHAHQGLGCIPTPLPPLPPL